MLEILSVQFLIKLNVLLLLMQLVSQFMILISFKNFKKKNFLIEDCSQSPGAKMEREKVGSFSDISAFSTMYRKTLHSGGNGGIVFTKF